MMVNIMGYLHIDNLYKNQDVLIFKEVYALEKIHGTSAHISWVNGKIHFFSGGESYNNFVKIFDEDVLGERLSMLGHSEITIFGEAYGGRQQKQAWRYGDKLRFVAFDVKIDKYWLDVDDAHQVVENLGLDFVYYKRVQTHIDALDAERDAPSEQARKNGVIGDKPREGVVLRPLREFTDNSGKRIIAKHKRPEERETNTERNIADPALLKVLDDASAIATEWVTPMRLEHVLDKLVADIGGNIDMSWTPEVIKRMIDDVLREGRGEIIDSKAARKAMGARTAALFKKRFEDHLRQ